MNSKPLVIYHGNCPDGFTAAWCFRKKFGRGMVDFHPGVYQTEPPDVSDRRVFLVDFSYKREVVRGMLDEAESITLIDHHKSAIEDLSNLNHPKFTKIVDVQKSGARLAWEFLFGSLRPPQALLHVEDRDLWRFNLKYTKEVTAAILSYDYNFNIWDWIMSWSGEYSNDIPLIVKGSAVNRKHQKDVRELVASLTKKGSIAGYEVPVINVPYTYGSEACAILSVGKPFAAYYYDKPDGREFGLRSSPDGLDVSEIAKEFGGGGHKHASGFRVPLDHELCRL